MEQILPGTSPQKGEQQDKRVESYEWELPFMYTIFRLLLQIHKWIRDIHRRNCALSRRFGKEHYLSQLHYGRGYSLSLLEVCKSRGLLLMMSPLLELFQCQSKYSFFQQGCCLTGTCGTKAPTIYPRATKISNREPKWAPKTYDSQANFQWTKNKIPC